MDNSRIEGAPPICRRSGTDMTMWLLLMVTLSLTMTASRGSDICPDGMYLDGRSALCRQCTVCPVNTIIRVPCRSGSDTICGPFFEFTFFNNGELGDNRGGDDGATYGREPAHADPMTSSYRPDTDVKAAADDDNRDVVEKSSDRWRELCFGLMGALAAVSSLAIVYVIITHLRHRHGSCKNSSLDDCELPVVYYHTQLLARTPSPDQSPSNLYTQLRDTADGQLLYASRCHGNGVLGDQQPIQAHQIRNNRSPPVFLLHPSPDVEMQKGPLARVHDNYKKRSHRSGRQTSGDPDDRQTAPVTEMLLSHHKCESEIS